MFQFGLFSTHLPYLIMGVVYVFYIGFSSVQKIESGYFSEGIIEISEPFTWTQNDVVNFAAETEKTAEIQSLMDLVYKDCLSLLSIKNVYLSNDGLNMRFSYRLFDSKHFNKPPPTLI